MKKVHPLTIIFSVLFFVGILYFFNKRKNEENPTTATKKPTASRDIASKPEAKNPERDVAQEKEQNEEKPRDVNKADPDLEKLMERYRAKDELVYEGVTYLASDYSAVLKKDYDPSMGEKIEELFGKYVVYNSLQGHDEKSSLAIVINTLTYKPGVVTGKVLVQVTDENRVQLAELSRKEHFKFGLLWQNTGIQEIHVKPALRTFALNPVLKEFRFSLIQIEIIETEKTIR